MRSIVWLALVLLSACATSGIFLKKGDRFFLYEEANKRPLMSFSIPEGTWSISKVALETMRNGWFDIIGGPTNSPFGYSVRFSIVPAVRRFNEFEAVFKSGDFTKFANSIDIGFSPKELAEMHATNYGQKLIQVGTYNCKNSWYQQRLVPQLNNGQGIPLFRNFIECPLVLDGRVFIFSINVNSSMRQDFIKQQNEFNKDGEARNQVAIDAYAYLSTLGDKVLMMFNDIQFQGKVSQNYSDIVHPELLQEKVDHPVPYQPRLRKKK